MYMLMHALTWFLVYPNITVIMLNERYFPGKTQRIIDHFNLNFWDNGKDFQTTSHSTNKKEKCIK